MKLQVDPIGVTLSAEVGMNLLDVLLHEQVPISYSCMSGRCGICRCKVTAGSVAAATSAMGSVHLSDPTTVLACQSVLEGDLTIEIPDPGEVVHHPARTLKATVVGKIMLGRDVLCLQLKLAKPLDYSPGQYATLQFKPGYERPYSMAGLASDEFMEFHLRIVPNGIVTTFVAAELKPGDTLKISGPLGAAYLRKKHQGETLCVASGTGMAPVLSLIKGSIAEGLRNPIRLYYAALNQDDLYALDAVYALQKDHGQLTVIPVLANHQGSADFRGGLVTEAITQDFTSLAAWNAYLCGSPPMVEATAKLVGQLGMAPEQIYADAFYPYR